MMIWKNPSKSVPALKTSLKLKPKLFGNQASKMLTLCPILLYWKLKKKSDRF
jgi:hypothetical protein